MPKLIEEEPYLSVPEAAQRVGVSRATMFRWASQQIRLNGSRIKVVQDPINKHYYVAERSVKKLADRFHTP
jgi:predicted site-specific integrase-resolvase